MKDLNVSDISITDLKKRIKIYDTDIVYFGGSLIESKVNKFSKGIGNYRSDLDLFIIRESINFKDTSATYSSDEKKTSFFKLGKINVDVEIYDKDFVLELTENINSIVFSLDSRIKNSFVFPGNTTNYGLNSFLNRLMNSLCIQNEQAYLDVKKNINIAKWQEFQKNYLINSIENTLEDAVGNLEENKYEIAVLCTRNAFLDLVRYTIFFLHDLTDREKWLYIKLTNISIYHKEYKEMYKRFNLLFFSDLTTEENKRMIALDCIKFIKIQIESMVIGELI